MNADKLLPCPFCGGAAEDDEFGGYVRCTNITDASGGCFMAIDWVSAKKWNTRPAPTEAEVEAAAMRIMATDRRDVARVDSYWAWLMPVEQENYRRMARAALGVGHE